MNEPYIVFESFSCAINVGVTILSVSGETWFASSVWDGISGFTERLLSALDCTEGERMALLYGCYQARRFGGRYIFLAPSGLAYCASPLIGSRDEMTAGAIAGPFLMTDYDEYFAIDVSERVSSRDALALGAEINAIPYKTPVQARAISEQLHLCSVHYGGVRDPGYPIQSDLPVYPLDKEDDLLAAVSKGDIGTAGAVLNDILGQVLFDSGNNFEVLRSRVFELTVLLSRAALKGGANIDAIFGLNYEFLSEIDAISSAEAFVKWLHGVTRRFGQHVFVLSDTKHTDIIRKASDYIKKHYMNKIVLQDIADRVFLSPTYFSKVFKDETGQTPSGFLTAVRVDASKRLLRDPAVSIVDIPVMVGFANQSYFTRVFKTAVGQTPGEYRRGNRHA